MRRMDRRVLVGATSALVLVLGAVTIPAVRSRKIPPATSVGLSGPSVSAPLSVLPPPPPPPSTSIATAAPVEPPPDQIVDLSVPPVPTPTKVRSQSPSKPRPAPSARAKPGCDPPYRVNADGITVFKPECL